MSGYFCEFDGNGNVTLRDSSQYNHNLAILSMALSYATYNPIAYQAIPFVPSSFMQEPYNDETKTAEADPESKGFVAQEYNYDGLLSVAAHTIGHRTVEINDIETNNNNLIGEIENDGFTWGTGTDTMGVRGRTNSIDSVDSVSVNYENLGITSVLNSEDLDGENYTGR